MKFSYRSETLINFFEISFMYFQPCKNTAAVFGEYKDQSNPALLVYVQSWPRFFLRQGTFYFISRAFVTQSKAESTLPSHFSTDPFLWEKQEEKEASLCMHN